MPPNRLDDGIPPPPVFAAKRRQMSIEDAALDEIGHDQLDQVLRLRIDLLLDQRELLDNRADGADPSEAQPRRQHLRKAVQADDDVAGVVELEQ